MKRIFILTLLIVLPFLELRCQEMVSRILPNGDSVNYSVIFKDCDSINGNVIAVFYNDTNKLAFKEVYYRGKPNGLFLYYFPNGRYLQTMVYGYGQLHGDYTIYCDTGTVIKKGQYKNGLKHGYWIDLQINLTGRYQKGKRHKTWKLQDSNDKSFINKWQYFKGELRKGDAKKAALLNL